MVITIPSRQAISRIGRLPSASHSCSPQGIGSIRLSVTVARQRALTSEISHEPSNSGAITTKSMSLYSSALPRTYEPKSTARQA
jgi:hypothetical protein